MVDTILYLVVQHDIFPYVLGLNRIENYSSVLMLDSLKTCWNVEYVYQLAIGQILGIFYGIIFFKYDSS